MNAKEFSNRICLCGIFYVRLFKLLIELHLNFKWPSIAQFIFFLKKTHFKSLLIFQPFFCHLIILQCTYINFNLFQVLENGYKLLVFPNNTIKK